MPDFPGRTRLPGFRWHLKPKLAHEALVTGLEVRTRLALFCHYSSPRSSLPHLSGNIAYRLHWCPSLEKERIKRIKWRPESISVVSQLRRNYIWFKPYVTLGAYGDKRNYASLSVLSPRKIDASRADRVKGAVQRC
jgi:hypothetical protein